MLKTITVIFAKISQFLYFLSQHYSSKVDVISVLVHSILSSNFVYSVVLLLNNQWYSWAYRGLNVQVGLVWVSPE